MQGGGRSEAGQRGNKAGLRPKTDSSQAAKAMSLGFGVWPCGIDCEGQPTYPYLFGLIYKGC